MKTPNFQKLNASTFTSRKSSPGTGSAALDYLSIFDYLVNTARLL